MSLKLIIATLLCLMMNGSFTNSEHALYLSLTEIDINPGNGIVRIKVFSDDLQSAIKNNSEAFQNSDPKDIFEKNESIINKYLTRKISVAINGNKLPLEYLDHSVENDAHFVRYSFSHTVAPHTVRIKADFLTEIFPTQTNIIKISFEEKQYFLKFEKTSSPQEVILSSH